MSDLDLERFTLRQAAQARDDFAPGDERAGVREGATGPPPDAQGSGVCPPKDNVRVGSHRRRTRHSLVGRVLAAFPLRAGRRGCLAAVVVALLLNTVGLVSDS
jgi:hypothetical protein